MRALSLVDYLFLLLEKNKQPMHVAGLCIFELPDTCNQNFVKELLKDINPKMTPNFPFNQVLFGGFFWKQAKIFHLHKHCSYHRLPNGLTDELFSLISSFHEQKLDRSRPLWSLHLIDNLNPEKPNGKKRFALYLKTHHAVVDGVAAMRLFQRSLSHCPDEKNSLPLWANNISQTKLLFDDNKKSSKGIFFRQIKSLPPVFRELMYNFSQKKNGCSDFIGSFDAPYSILNQRIGAARYLSMHAFDKTRFIQVAKKFSVSTNDVILAVCGYALRTYLISQKSLPDKSLIAFVPISFRNNSSMLGNQISFIPANLGTDTQDDIARLTQIHHNLKLGKQRFSRMDQTQIINYTALHYGWAGINLATGIYPKKQAFNLVISNIPGEDTPLYLNGAKLTGIYPASVLFDGQALNISFTNYQNRIDFGITACQDALPNIYLLPKLIEEALQTYENLVPRM